MNVGWATPAPGVTVQEAAYGATFGDAIGTALLNPTSAGLQTVISTNAQGETVFEGMIANALLTIATGQYVVGIDCDLLPEHTPLQGEAGASGELELTILEDTPPEFETSVAGAIFTAGPGGNPPLGTTNTLNTGDILVSTVGDATLNYTAVNNGIGLANDPFAVGVSMTGIATANITNLTDGIAPNDMAGFAGDITGLTTLTLTDGSNPFGVVQVGLPNLGLNTALETLNINSGLIQSDSATRTILDSGFVNVWIESAAFAGGEALDLNLNDVGSFVTLNVTGGDAFYETVNVHSLTGDNHLVLGTNAETIATINVDGDQDLRICGDALNQDTLPTFNASAATGDVTAIFEGPNDGGVDVTGGDGNDNFWFLVTEEDQDEGETTFTADNSVDGGGGDNTLTLQAFEGALLGAGVGANITNITTIVHSSDFDPCIFFGDDCSFNPMQGDLTVDMAESGDATVLELAGFYGDFGLSFATDVDVTNLENGDRVIFSGIDIGVLTLEHVNAAGTFNLVMAQDPCVENFADDPVTHLIETLDTNGGAFLNIDSLGNASENVIFEADLIDTDITATGDVDLSIGGVVDFNEPGFSNQGPALPGPGFSYDFDGGRVNASELQGNLFLATGAFQQTVFTGLGDDYVIVNAFIRDVNFFFPQLDNDLVDLGTGGSDTVQFDGAVFNPFQPLAIAGDFYNQITGFDVADDVIVQNPTFAVAMDWLTDTQGTPLFVQPFVDPLLFFYTTGQGVDASTDAFNFIKIETPVNTGGAVDAQTAFDTAMGPFTGFIQLGAGAAGDWFAGSYFDATNEQMVLFNVNDSDVNGFITSFDDVAVVAVVDMTAADYAAFGADNLSYTPFV